MKTEHRIVNDAGTVANSNISFDTKRWEKAGTWLIAGPEVLGWYYKAVYQGHSLKRTRDGWLLIIRADFGRLGKVCFTRGSSPADCVLHAAWDIKERRMQWQEDAYSNRY